MNKIILALAVLVLAAPALAVDITATVTQVQVLDPVTNNPVWIDSDEVVVSYDATADPNLVRAFALNIEVNSSEVNAFPTIDSVTLLEPNYYIFPGSIDINAITGVVDNFGSLACSAIDYPGPDVTLGGLDTNGVTVEMASLYWPTGAASPNKPATSGQLFKFTVTDNCTVRIGENTTRGGVVMEDGSSGTNFPNPFNVGLYTAADVLMWRAMGRPKCWVRGKVPRQCHGDADGTGEGFFKNIHVATRDLTVFLAAWNLKDFELGLPNDPCTVNVGGKDVKWICADFEHTGEGFFKNIRVATRDLGIFLNFWNKLPSSPSSPDPNCP